MGPMGCDIHCYIEYRPKNAETWRDFGGRINPGRNYWMFGTMAGVRRDDLPFIKPRGWPEDCALAAFNDNTHYVSETQTEDFKHSDSNLTYSRTHAEEYVAKGYCQYVSRNGLEKHWVTNCDHHSHSWLTADEFELAIAGCLKASGFQIGALRLTDAEGQQALATIQKTDDQVYALSCITEYWAVLASMRCFEAQGCQSRLVFWFDN